MNKLLINIVDSYWGVDDKLGIYEQGRKNRFSGTYYIEDDIETFEKKLLYVIFSDKNDGLQLEVNMTAAATYIDIILFLGDQTDEEYDIQYILDFLEGNSIEPPYNNGLKEKKEKYSEEFIYIQYAPEDLGETLEKL